MNLVIKKIEINNFKGITDLKLNFTDNKNILEGENGIGKTTVLDAITWCLFGKNFADEKQFNIKPIIDGEEKVDLLTSVELLINDTTIERIWDIRSIMAIRSRMSIMRSPSALIREKKELHSILSLKMEDVV